MTNEQRFETLCILEATQEELVYMIEKRTRDEYAREKFKKKYKFVPDKPGSNKGTITINGEKRHVDMGKSSMVNFGGQDTVRQTAADINSKNGDILLDKNYFKLKNQKRRDAVIQHEVGHTKLHSVRGDSNVADPRSFSPKNRGVARRNAYNGGKENLESMGKETLKMFGIDPSSKSTRKMLNDNLDAAMGKSDKKYNERSKKNPYRKEREELLKQAGKYRSKSSSHANEQEFEADRFAANRAGAKNLKAGVREYTNKTKKMYKNMKGLSNDQKKQVVKNYNKVNAIDQKARSKALKDKKLRDAELYK